MHMHIIHAPPMQTEDFQYYINTLIGDPNQQSTAFRMLVDSGSANVWVPSTECSTPSCKGRTKLDPNTPGAFEVRSAGRGVVDGAASVAASGVGAAAQAPPPLTQPFPQQTLNHPLNHPLNQPLHTRPPQQSGRTVGIAYGIGGVQGATGSSTMRLAGAYANGTSGSLQFTQPLVLATQLTGVFGAEDGKSAPWDGLFGLGRQALAEDGMRPPVQSMADQGQVASPVLGIWVAHDSSGPGRGGEMAFGGWNADRIQGDINW
jgi:hypothetical protein